MIMILDVDVTAERRHYKTHCPLKGSLCTASLRGPSIGGQDSDGVSNRRSALYTLCLFEAFPSRGNEKIGGTGYCVTYDTDSQSRNVLASPLGEEGHEVAKGVQANWIHRGAPRPANPVRRHPAKSVWTVVRMIMTLDMDVTAEGGIIKICGEAATTTLGLKGRQTYEP